MITGIKQFTFPILAEQPLRGIGMRLWQYAERYYDTGKGGFYRISHFNVPHSALVLWCEESREEMLSFKQKCGSALISLGLIPLILLVVKCYYRYKYRFRTPLTNFSLETPAGDLKNVMAVMLSFAGTKTLVAFAGTSKTMRKMILEDPMFMKQQATAQNRSAIRAKRLSKESLSQQLQVLRASPQKWDRPPSPRKHSKTHPGNALTVPFRGRTLDFSNE
ncbi:MAG: hypothetical protein H0X51_07955 [Parachlamydiaceae bacterium]|nr:hypothetical protein [Parachlamydiaceae bacterium]